MTEDNDLTVEADTPQSSDALRGLRIRVTRALTDATRNNPLIYYRDSRSTRFSLPDYGTPPIAKLLNGAALRRPDLMPALQQTLSNQLPEPRLDKSRRLRSAVPADPWLQRFKAIRAKARENEQERGLRTLYAAIGMVTWPVADGGRPPMAPLFLVPLQIKEDERAPDDLIVTRIPDGEVILNRALLTVAPSVFAEVAQNLFEGGVVDDVDRSWRELTAATQGLSGLELLPATALGIFNFSMMAIVEDINDAGDALANHIVIRALAGDIEAQKCLRAAREGSVDVATLDTISPADEPFVLDADPWQARTIQTLLKYSDSNAVCSGPPGTGKSQTIANLIVSLIAQGKTVLFTCEKRAALEVVKRRLAAAGLGSLVLDMHGAAITRQHAYSQLRASAQSIRSALQPKDSVDAVLESTRDNLNAHVSFMHTPIDSIGMSPFQLLSAVAALPAFDLRVRIDAAGLANVDGDRIDELASLAAEASRSAAVFMRKADIPWAAAPVSDAGRVPAAIDAIAPVAPKLKLLRATFSELGVPIRTRAELLVASGILVQARAAVKDCAPTILGLETADVDLAASTLASPFAALLTIFPGARRSAVRAARRHLRATSSASAAAALKMLNSLTGAWREKLAIVAALSPDVDRAAASISSSLDASEAALGVSLPDKPDEAEIWAATCTRDRDAAYRAARMRQIEEELERSHLGPLIDDFATLPPSKWAPAVRFVFLQSFIEPLRPRLLRFDGRQHDGVVSSFTRAESELRSISRDRVLRAACHRLIRTSNERPEQAALVAVEMQRKRPRKPLRSLYSDAPDAMLALAPCVMASPLSISQFLPRSSIFDVVIFDEGSQVTPESAITAILRGRRVVVAGDERQLPPTDFFKAATDEDNDDGDSSVAITGTESILAALRPFAKELDLRVHYRSRDERLIAFSNHYVYGDQLITFPGTGSDGQALKLEVVDPSGMDFDEESQGPEVRRVVDLIIEHAEQRPAESLGVIALGAPHANRIENLLAATKRTRPDLDLFFSEGGAEPFFIKNLERVQGDERDAIILTVGYGRTKTGAVSHNFGPINHDGGERRLNVAITRAKTRLTLVASFRKRDLNPNALVKTGSKLLAAYLGYAESAGTDLGRDAADVSIPPNAFEADIQRALQHKLGVGIVPQYGVGNFRIDLAVQHPSEPGRFVLAVECDGASYHSAPTARLRDRLRQDVLEGLGWSFCRIWSTDWFNNREMELERVAHAYRLAVARDGMPCSITPTTTEVVQPPNDLGRVRPSPARPPYRSIDDISDLKLRELRDWIASDGRLRTNEEMIAAMTRELGFQRRGARIVERLSRIIR